MRIKKNETFKIIYFGIFWVDISNMEVENKYKYFNTLYFLIFDLAYCFKVMITFAKSEDNFCYISTPAGLL